MSKFMRTRVWMHRHRLGFVVTLLMTLGVIVLLSDRIFVVVPSGSVGVLFSPFFGTDTRFHYDEGMHVLPPWDKMYVYEVRIQQREDTIVMYANDGLELHLRLSTQFHVPRGEAARIQEYVGPDYVRKLVKPDIFAAVRSVIGNYSESDVYARDERGLLTDLRDVATRQSVGVHFDGIKILEMTLPDSIERAIQHKLAEQQVAFTQNYRVLAAEGEARRKAAEAVGYAAFARITGIPALQLRQIEAAELFARSPNAKLVLYGGGTNAIPLVLNGKMLP